MARAVVRLLPFEMAILGLFELASLFAMILAMLTAGGPALLLGSNDIPRDGVVLAALLAVTIAGTAATIGLYRPEVCLDRKRVLLCAGIAAAVAFPAILLVSGACRMVLSGDHVVWLARVLGLWLPFVLLVRLAFSALFTRMPVARRVLIVGSGARAARLRLRLSARANSLFEPVSLPVQIGAKPADGQRLPTGLSASFIRDRRVWGIVIAQDERAPDDWDGLFENKLRGVPVYSDLSFQDRYLGRVELDAIDADWLLFAEGFENGLLSRGLKRALDIVVSMVMMFITLPVMIVTAALIKMDSPGPVFYRQKRTGLHGKTFTLFKFRSMRTDAEAAGKPQWAQQGDPRVTRIGGYLRATRIDELPQLFNVLRGEMSMIGPRPERPEFVDDLARVIPFYNHRASVKPGLTGWAQVNYPYGASIEDAREKLAYDLYYVKNHGIVLDLVILLSTVRVVLFREGAR